MRNATLVLVAAVACIATSVPAHAGPAGNIALGAAVSVVATDPDPNAGFANNTAGNLNKVTDGTLLPEGTGYGSGTATANAIEWSGAGYVFQINLGALYTISSILLQGDDNDTYYLQYLNTLTNTWTALYTAPTLSQGVGIVTRPSEYDPAQFYNLATPVTTSKVRFYGGQSNDNFCFDGTCGQGGYAVSQVELIGTAASVAVPEPASLALLGLGVLALQRIRRRPTA